MHKLRLELAWEKSLRMESQANGERDREKDAQGASTQEIHFLDVLIILSKRRKFILSFTLTVSILTAIAVLIIPSKYTAETIVLPPNQNSSMSSSLLSQVGNSSALASIAGASLGIKSPADMYVSLFRTQPVEDALIQHFGLMARYRVKKMSDARLAFEHQSMVVLGTKDGLINISVTDRDPDLAAAIANGYVDEFRNLSAHLAISEASQRRAFFEKELQEADGNLVTAEEAMKSTEQSTGVLQIDSQARALIESAATLRGQIGAKQVELRAMRSYATEDNPQMVMAKQQLDALKDQLTQLTGTSANSNSDIIVPKGNIPTAQIEYLRSLRDVQYYQTIKEILAREFEMAKLDEAREGAIIQVAQVATPPDKRSSPKRTLSVIVALILSFFVACGWCFLAERIDHFKQNPVERGRLDVLRATLGKRYR